DGPGLRRRRPPANPPREQEEGVAVQGREAPVGDRVAEEGDGETAEEESSEQRQAPFATRPPHDGGPDDAEDDDGLDLEAPDDRGGGHAQPRSYGSSRGEVKARCAASKIDSSPVLRRTLPRRFARGGGCQLDSTSQPRSAVLVVNWSWHRSLHRQGLVVKVS